MRIIVFIKEALESLRINKVRSFLTMLGIVIGIAAIVIIISVGNGAQSLVINEVNNFGSDLVGIMPGSSDDEGPPVVAMGITITTLKNKDAEAIRDQVPGVKAITGYVMGTGTISWGNQNVDANYTGVGSDYINVEEANIAQGHFLTADDNNALRQVVVLGWGVYKDLFGNSDPIGQRIRIKRQSFRVIGVMEERGTAMFQNQDDQVFIPLLTAQKKVLGIDHVSLIRSKAVEGQDLESLAEDIKIVLRNQHDIEPGATDDFQVVNTEKALDILGTITDVLKYFLAAISGLSLIVSGIGIMNIMLISVLERTREIGLRKALGARPYDLRAQFLVETVVITSLGGILGFIIGVAIAYGIAQLAQALGYSWDYNIGLLSIILAAIFPILIGLIFGFYPAQKASKLKPVEALHYE